MTGKKRGREKSQRIEPRELSKGSCGERKETRVNEDREKSPRAWGDGRTGGVVAL